MQNINMFTLFIRSIFIYLIVLIIFRLMGKRQLGELQPFEFVITLIIADLATIPMAEINIPLLHGVIPLLTLTAIQFLITFLSSKSLTMRKIINGKPVIVISPNGIDYENMKKLNMNMNDLTEALRGMNYFSLDQIEYAIVETNGKVSVMPTSSNSPLVKEDLKIKSSEATLPIILACEGKLVKENLQVANLSESFVLKQISKVGCYDIKEVVILTLDKNGKVCVQCKDKPAKVLQTNFKGGDW